MRGQKAGPPANRGHLPVNSASAMKAMAAWCTRIGTILQDRPDA
jgi:hypothetical protein